MATTTHCPTCNNSVTESIYPNFSGTCVTSDMEILPNAGIANRICCGCGLIFNATGTRGVTKEFYRDSYSLMIKAEQGAIQSFSSTQPISPAEKTFQILREFHVWPESGSILEAGAGKGDFLGHFVKAFPGWKAHAFEPSKSYEFLTKSLPQIKAVNCDYRDFSVSQDPVDLVVALGVLEHVDNPLDMLVWGNRQLNKGGYFYLRVPNFAKNPNDLFCADHLSKLTIPTLCALAASAGFTVDAIREVGVPVFMLLRKSAPLESIVASAYAENRSIVDSNVDIAQGLVDSIQRCRNTAKAENANFAIFGLASAGLFAPFILGFEANEISAYIDENQTLWGSKLHGRPIGGSDLITQMKIRHIALSVSPIYFKQIKAKLTPYDVCIYTA
jgi:hypothetical protein